MSVQLPSATPDHHQPPDLPAPAGRTMIFSVVALVSSLGLTTAIQGGGNEYLATLDTVRTPIVAMRNGEVVALHANVGETLDSSDPLVELRDNDLAADIVAAECEIDAYEAELKRARAKASVEVAWRMKELDAEIFQTRLSSAGYLKEKFWNEVEGAAWNDFALGMKSTGTDVSPDDVFNSVVTTQSLGDEARFRAMLKREAARNAAEVNAAQVQICDNRLNELQCMKAELQAEIDESVGVRVAEAHLEQAKARLERLQQLQQGLTINGRPYRRVGTIHKKVGDLVQAGETIVELIDPDRTFVTVRVPVRDAARFTPETTVELEFVDGEKRAGHVVEVPFMATYREASSENAQLTEAFVDIRIEEAGELWPEVPIGSSVRVKLAE